MHIEVYNYIHESRKHGEQNKSDTKEYILYNFIFVKLKTGKTKLTLTEIRIVVALGWRERKGIDQEGYKGISDDGNAFCLDNGVDYMDVLIHC